MCTAISLKSIDHYFGRNLDLDCSYGESVIVTPRNYPFVFRRMPEMKTHYALIGMAANANHYPLYFEATNERGLSMAGLNFPGNAAFKEEDPQRDNITPFEFIPWILGQCQTVDQARKLIERIQLIDLAFSPEMPVAPLHWMIADSESSIVVECMKDGLHVYENPVGVMTNNPPFPVHLSVLNNYMSLSPEAPENHFSDQLDLKTYCLGMGSMGLPGDPSSMSRFVKAAFTLHNSRCGKTESSNVSQFFHVLGSVYQQRGISHVQGDRYEYTLYSSCCNTTRGIYYYTTYENNQITAIDMHKENLDASELRIFPLVMGQQFRFEN